MLRECNWLQALEGDIDTSHLNFLHYGALAGGDFAPTDADPLGAIHRDPEYKAEETELGTDLRRLSPGRSTAAPIGASRISCSRSGPCAPFIAFEHYRIARAWVPLDDTHMMFVMIGPKDRAGGVRQPEHGSAAEHDRLARPLSQRTDAENDYLIDREVQRTESFTGIEGIHIQDQAVTESMGAITDHAFENLAASDRMVVITRQRLLAAAKALAENGAVPPGAATAEAYGRVRGGFFLAPHARVWPDVYHQQLAAVGSAAASEAAE